MKSKTIVVQWHKIIEWRMIWQIKWRIDFDIPLLIAIKCCRPPTWNTSQAPRWTSSTTVSKSAPSWTGKFVIAVMILLSKWQPMAIFNAEYIWWHWSYWWQKAILFWNSQFYDIWSLKKLALWNLWVNFWWRWWWWWRWRWWRWWRWRWWRWRWWRWWWW